jgi:hypothetical protein
MEGINSIVYCKVHVQYIKVYRVSRKMFGNFVSVFLD